MKNYYITFGQAHAHCIAGVTYDRNCVAMIQAPDESQAREKAFEIFGNKWSFIHLEGSSELFDLETYYPKGIIKV